MNSLNTSSLKHILFVGQRRGAATAAAEALQHAYFIVHEQPLKREPGSYEKGRLQHSFKQPDLDALIPVIERAMPHIDAVIPLGEGAVMLAARLEAHFLKRPHSVERALDLTHKGRMKQRARAHQIPCADFIIPGDPLPVDWSFPCVVKTAVGSGSRGLVIAENKATLDQALQPGWMAERFIAGKEFSVESFVSNGHIVLTNITDYTEPKWENVVPAGFESEILQRIEVLNRQVIKAFGITSGMTHLEVFDTRRGLMFGEVAHRPPGGFIMDLISTAYALDAWQLYLQCCLNTQDALDVTPACFAGVRMMHPGEGDLKGIAGVKEAKALGTVKITKKIGQRLTRREGVGESAGYLMAQAPYKEQVTGILTRMNQHIHWELG